MNLLTTTNNQSIYMLKNKNKLYTNIIEDKQSILLFMNNNSANKCIDFLSYHKQIYGEWPMIESYSSKKNNNVKVELKKIPVPKRLELNLIKNSLVVDECSLEFAYFVQKVTNMGILGINYFDYNMDNEKIDITIKGSQLELTQDINEKNLINFMSMSFDLLYYSQPNKDQDDYIDILDIDSN